MTGRSWFGLVAGAIDIIGCFRSSNTGIVARVVDFLVAHSESVLAVIEARSVRRCCIGIEQGGGKSVETKCRDLVNFATNYSNSNSSPQLRLLMLLRVSDFLLGLDMVGRDYGVDTA